MPNKGYLIRFASLAVLFALSCAQVPVHAYGVSVTGNPSNGEIDAATTAGRRDVQIYWTTSGPYASDTIIQVNLAWSGTAPTSTSLRACSTSSSTAFGATGYYTGATASQIQWNHAAIAGSKHGGLCISVPIASNGAGTLPTQNFSLAIVTTGSTVDAGAVEFYVNGGNDVAVNGTVPATISFMITEPANVSVEKHLCDLGILNSGSVNSCQYRLKVGTNAVNGYLVSAFRDHDFATGLATITNIGAGGSFASGTEAYGFALTPAVRGGRDVGTGLLTLPALAVAPYDTNSQPVPATLTSYLRATYPFSSTSTFSTSLVTHRASVNDATPAGVYTQIVTYRVTGSF